MDLMRGGYTTLMRFYVDDTAATQVVWYKVPDDRPFLPHPHVFADQDWENDNHPWDRQAGEYGLGEQLDAERKRPGRPLPRRVRFLGTYCGTAREWAEGAGLPVVGPPLLPDGFPPCCGDLACPLPNIFLCRTLYLFALALRAQYQGRAIVQNFISSQLMNHPDFRYSQDNSGSLIPGITMAVCDGWCLILVSGTGNFNQWIGHALGSVAPSNYTTGIGVPYGTAPMYADAAQVVQGLVANADLPPDMPIVLVGHSFGGAVANVAALRLAEQPQPRLVQVVTFGAPKAMRHDGQQALARANLPLINVVNDGDPVPRLPPWLTVSRVNPILAAVAALWDMWGDNRNRVGLRVNGSLYGDPTTYVQTAVLFRLLLGLQRNDDIAPWQPHEMDEYVRRLALQNCDGAVIADVFVWLMPETLRVDTVLPGFIPPGAGSVGIWLDASQYGHLPVWNGTSLTLAPVNPVGWFGPRGYEGLTLTVQVLNPLDGLYTLYPVFLAWDDGPDSTGAFPYPYPAQTTAATWVYAMHLRTDFPGLVGDGSLNGTGPGNIRMTPTSMTFDDGYNAYTLDFPSEVVEEAERVCWFTLRDGSVSMGVETEGGSARQTFDLLGPAVVAFLYGSVGAFIDPLPRGPEPFPADLAVMYEVLIFAGPLTDANLAVILDRMRHRYLFGPGGLLTAGSSAMSHFTPAVLYSGGPLTLAGSSLMAEGSDSHLVSGGELLLAGSSVMAAGSGPLLVSAGGLFTAGSSGMAAGSVPFLVSAGGLFTAGSSGMVHGAAMLSGGGLFSAGSSAMA